jgi:riboflavin synthase
MFTGIVESMGRVVKTEQAGTNISFWIESALSDELKIDQSVSHSGVCLTVDEKQPGRHRVTAVAETLERTNLSGWLEGTAVNLERCLPMNGRLDGHLVQGHADALALCVEKEDKAGSWLYTFSYPGAFAHLLVEKGSICLNGVSLTAFGLERNLFRVAIIPYTYAHTNLHGVEPGHAVNAEFDLIGKYLARWRSLAIQEIGPS